MFSHGQKKFKKTQEQLLKEKEINEETEKVCKRFLEVRRNYHKENKPLDELLTYSSEILELMSDQSTVINFRQELISQKFATFKQELKSTFTKDNPENALQLVLQQIKSFLKNELTFNGKLVMNDLKSYQLWFHRLWLLKTFAFMENALQNKLQLKNSIAKKIITNDLQMCEMFLNKDERNFHAWNFRFNLWKVMKDLFPNQLQELITQEIDFINKIHQKNYSNYSAIHFKIKFFEMQLQSQPLSLTFFNSEMQKINEGLFISPNEQALYIYQRWIFKQMLPLKILTITRIDNNKLEIIFNKEISTTLVAQHIKLQGQDNNPPEILTHKTSSVHIICAPEDAIILLTHQGKEIQTVKLEQNNAQELSNNSQHEPIKKYFNSYLEFFDDIECSSLEVLQHKLLNEQNLDLMLQIKFSFFPNKLLLEQSLKNNLQDFLNICQDYNNEIKQNKFLEELTFNIHSYLTNPSPSHTLQDILTIYSI